MTADRTPPPNPDAVGRALLQGYAERWRTQPDGDAFATASSILQPVLWTPAAGAPRKAMLKLARPGAAGDEERAGFALQQWWGGNGAAMVFERGDDAVLLERALGRRSLAAMASRSSAADDDHALRLLCQSVARLHEPRPAPPALVSLERWFAELFEHADAGGAGYLRGADLAAELLDEPGDIVVLHGDVHHGNVLDFGGRGWLAIDPKGLSGTPAFDYANMLCNPSPERAAHPEVLARRAATVALASGIAAGTLLRWTVAWTALSATWHRLGDDAAAAARKLAIGDTATRLLLDA
ncbi:aminoglycoside phosphotransferase family protein [Microterricola pindariensis]|uniref:aminoglycoside phosphotransferase family protein n=1 Tax=Microterricola pindariensis TaxID=478010 RepID=UPI000CEC7724|nr:aminoglycoside phosphotransferase family protein [Microterricola pindariensis]